ncbi:MAG: glycosyltransferase family 4 protein [Bacilli bacterium]|jgi:1,2-diacylglycerol-3-alpha-glucose alpha-1,2-glucosyltransferase|nr:glycosyltransferase family 4 protein [Bacilli bacterium]
MKVCIYFEGVNNIAKSGIGRAFKHQVKICEEQGINYTTDYKDRYDILHINTVFLKSSEAISYARKQGAKVIYHAHSTKEDFQNSFAFSNFLAPGLKQWLIYLYSKADLIITPSEYSKSLLLDYGIDVPITSLSNGINIERFSPNRKKELKFRRYFDLKRKDKVIISVGLWFERKGILDFIKLAKAMPNYKFIWFGHTPKVSIPIKITSAMDKKSSNCFFPGYISGDIIEGAFSGADVFVFMSHEETEGIVVLEALASKQNVLIRDIPVYNNWLINKENVLKSKNLRGFKSGIEYYINNPQNNIRINGFKVAEQKDIKKVGVELKKIYLSLLDK